MKAIVRLLDVYHNLIRFLFIAYFRDLIKGGPYIKRDYGHMIQPLDNHANPVRLQSAV